MLSFKFLFMNLSKYVGKNYIIYQCFIQFLWYVLNFEYFYFLNENHQFSLWISNRVFFMNMLL